MPLRAIAGIASWPRPPAIRIPEFQFVAEVPVFFGDLQSLTDSKLLGMNESPQVWGRVVNRSDEVRESSQCSVFLTQRVTQEII